MSCNVMRRDVCNDANVMLYDAMRGKEMLKGCNAMPGDKLAASPNLRKEGHQTRITCLPSRQLGLPAWKRIPDKTIVLAAHDAKHFNGCHPGS